MAVATPTIVPVPIAPAREVIKASKMANVAFGIDLLLSKDLRNRIAQIAELHATK